MTGTDWQVISPRETRGEPGGDRWRRDQGTHFVDVHGSASGDYELTVWRGRPAVGPYPSATTATEAEVQAARSLFPAMCWFSRHGLLEEAMGEAHPGEVHVSGRDPVH